MLRLRGFFAGKPGAEMFRDVWGAAAAYLRWSDAGRAMKAKVSGVWSYDQQPVELEGIVVDASKHGGCWLKLLLGNGREVTVGDPRTEREDVRAYSIQLQPVEEERRCG